MNSRFRKDTQFTELFRYTSEFFWIELGYDQNSRFYALKLSLHKKVQQVRKG